MSKIENFYLDQSPASNSRLPERILMGFGIFFAVLLAFCMFFSARWPYAYSAFDSLTLLYTRGFFHSSNDLTPLVPYSQINFPAAIICWLADSFGPLRNVVLWAAQMLTAYLLVYRLHQLALRLLSPIEALFALIVVLVHPTVWASLLFAPSQVVTAWFALEALVRTIDASNTKSGEWNVSFYLFALSFCGANGYFWALSICVISCFLHIKQKQYFLTAASLLPILPATFFYLLLSIRWGVLGGPILSNYPVLWQQVGLTALISGHWTQQVQSILFWVSKGGAGFPTVYMVFGLIAVIGVFSESNNNKPLPKFFFIALIIHISLCAFSSLHVFQNFALVSVLGVAILFIRGAGWLSAQLRNPFVQPVLGFLFALSLMVIAFFELQPLWEKARFYQFITTETQKQIGEFGSDAALQFSPNVFLNLADEQSPHAIGLHWRYQYKKTTITFQPPTIEQAFQRPYDWIGFFAPFSTSQTSLSESEQGPLLEQLLLGYEKERKGNLFIWHRNNNTQEQPYIMVGEPLGTLWDFEHGYGETHQIGAAFGLEPDHSQSAVGFACAGPGSNGANHLMGSISSTPFKIEGDELRFYADVPKSSTQTFFALAIRSESELNEKSIIQTTRHLFDRKPNEALMDKTFFYIEPSQLSYTDHSVSGWRVVRALQSYPTSGWRHFEWAVKQWDGKQAMWLAADRDANAVFRIDHIQQWNRPPGRYWNFESGTYAQWQTEGEAFGDAPVVKAIGAQSEVSNFEGNFFVNSFLNGSDAAMGRLLSEPFVVEYDQLTFLVGGGGDPLRTFVGLDVDGQYALRASGERSEGLREVEWDLAPWKGKTARIIIEDQSSGAWGHILADDFKLSNRQ